MGKNSFIFFFLYIYIRSYSKCVYGNDSTLIILTNITGKPVSWMMIAPSVTPRKMIVGSNNPAMRLYKFETDTGQVSKL